MADENTEDELILDSPIEDGEQEEQAQAPEPEELDFPDTLDDDEEVKSPHLVAQLRDKVTEQAKRIKHLEEEGSKPRIQRTKKPDLWEDCEGDPDKWEAALLTWQDNERKAEEQERSRTAHEEETVQSWTRELQAYKDNAQKLGKPDFGESEAKVIATLSPEQQTTLVMASKAPHKLIYALGKSPNRLAQLALITNPIKLAAAVARIEGERAMARKEPPNIDKPERGAAPLSQVDKDEKEKRLLAAAERDPAKFQDYREYKKAQRAKQAA